MERRRARPLAAATVAALDAVIYDWAVASTGSLTEGVNEVLELMGPLFDAEAQASSSG